MNYTPIYQLPRLEWLNKRGWETFQDFMVTYGYNPLSVEDYMKAHELLCDYRASDPFANKEEGDEADEEELEELEEGNDELYEEEEEEEDEEGDKESGMAESEEKELSEFGEVGDGMNDDDNEQDEMMDVNEEQYKAFDGMDEDDESFEDEEARENERLETIYRVRCEDEGIHQWLTRHGWQCIEEYMEYHGMSIAEDSEVEVIGAFIKADMRHEKGDIRTGLEEAANEMSLVDNLGCDNEQIGRSEALIEKTEVARQANIVDIDEGETLAVRFSIAEIAAKIRNSVQVKDWLCERGWSNLEQLMGDHGLDFYDDELIFVMGHHIKAAIEDNNPHALEELEKLLVIGHNQDRNTNQNSPNQTQRCQVAESEGMNQMIQNGQDAEMSG
ncbi:hypothetical protein NHQ30_009443 [Ciborinia camelliae]|nr:hypothetical protein NHQ30_009443 [Ciborinia camelliae]